MNDSKQETKYQFGPGDIRKLSILLVLLAAIIIRACGYITEYFCWILASLVFLYALDVFYTLTVTQRTTADFKAFIFQTAVPLFALCITGMVALLCEIDSSAIVTMFGLSLAYTTYVVGKPIKPSSDTKNAIEEDENRANNTNSADAKSGAAD